MAGGALRQPPGAAAERSARRGDRDRPGIDPAVGRARGRGTSAAGARLPADLSQRRQSAGELPRRNGRLWFAHAGLCRRALPVLLLLPGDTHVALRSIVLEDIDRIEVLRGSNSASYGANAFLGVVNIVTRDAADTHGAMVSVTAGDQHVRDHVARYGWGDGKASFRVTAARRVDRGFDNVIDDSKVARFQFRADLAPTERDDVMIQLGTAEVWRGEGARHRHQSLPQRRQRRGASAHALAPAIERRRGASIAGGA
ncbi:MAG: TonB-dependent receptor plug domain-containing protein [Sulfuritalea sp.]|nr:TonB-dependent receptor plug domain-containing protein [Sulfuritalea sp.]